MQKKSEQPAKRDTYRHGDLYRALLQAALELARKGGREAVVLREVTRQAGVSPNAAYRHFEDLKSLLRAVAWASQAELANTMEEEMARIPPSGNAVQDARHQLRAVGVGYLRFAREEPGLFRMAFSEHTDMSNTSNPASTGKSGLTPYQLLSRALDQLVEVGAITQERRNAAELFAWSAVHGFAMLMIDGPLRSMPKVEANVIGQRLIDMVERGL